MGRLEAISHFFQDALSGKMEIYPPLDIILYAIINFLSAVLVLLLTSNLSHVGLIRSACGCVTYIWVNHPLYYCIKILGGIPPAN